MKKNKSLNLGIVNNRILIVGVDSGKKLNYARFLFPEGDISKPFSFENTRPGFMQLKQQIRFNLAVTDRLKRATPDRPNRATFKWPFYGFGQG